MKKNLITGLLFFFISVLNAQMDMITAINTIGNNVVYTEYWDVRNNPGGKNVIAEKRYVVTLEAVKNKFGKVVGFDGNDTEEAGKKRIRYDHMYGSFDHYTHPAYFLKPSSKIAYVFINGVLFELEKFTSTTSFEIDKLWIPKVPKDRANDPVFSGAKMGDLKSVDLKKMVTDYFDAMKKVQDANPYNETIQYEVDEMKFIVDSTNESYKQKNAAYWNSAEGQKKLQDMRSKGNQNTTKTIKNTGTGILTVIYDNGFTTHINGGSSSSFPCSNNVYYAVKDDKGNFTQKGTLITGANQDCGGTLSAAAPSK